MAAEYSPDTRRQRASGRSVGFPDLGSPPPVAHRESSVGLTTYLLLVAVVLSACSPKSAPDGGLTDAELKDMLRVHPADSEWGKFALVSGVLDVDADAGCLWLASDDSRHLVVWPKRTTAQSNPFQIILANGEVVRPGDQVEGGGGFVTGDEELPEGIAPFPEKCARSDELAVFSAASTLTVVRASG